MVGVVSKVATGDTECCVLAWHPVTTSGKPRFGSATMRGMIRMNKANKENLQGHWLLYSKLRIENRIDLPTSTVYKYTNTYSIG